MWGDVRDRQSRKHSSYSKRFAIICFSHCITQRVRALHHFDCSMSSKLFFTFIIFVVVFSLRNCKIAERERAKKLIQNVIAFSRSVSDSVISYWMFFWHRCCIYFKFYEYEFVLVLLLSFTLNWRECLKQKKRRITHGIAKISPWSIEPFINIKNK